MVIDMNEGPVRTLEQVRQVVAGTQALQFRRAEDDEGRYGWIESVLRRFDYRQLPRSERGAVLAYLQHLSGYSRAQVTRLGSISVSHLYALSNSAPDRAQRVVLTKTRPTQAAPIGVRRARAPRGDRASSASTASTRATWTAPRVCTTSTRWTA